MSHIFMSHITDMISHVTRMHESYHNMQILQGDNDENNDEILDFKAMAHGLRRRSWKDGAIHMSADDFDRCFIAMHVCGCVSLSCVSLSIPTTAANTYACTDP